MDPEKPPPRPFITPRARAATRPSAGFAGEREAAKRALDETREAIQSGALVKAGADIVRDLERSLAGKPEPGDPGEVVARVVAAGDRSAGLPAVPLEGLQARLKVDGKVVAESVTGKLGLVTLPLGGLGDVSYEVEVLGTDCAPAACVTGRATRESGGDSHLVELPRTDAIKPQIERARPFEEGIRAARDRAALSAEVMTKALAAQEKRLVEYLAGLDAGAGKGSKGSTARAPGRSESGEQSEPLGKSEPPRTNEPREREPAKDETSVKTPAPVTESPKTPDAPKQEAPAPREPSPKTARPAPPAKGRATKPPGKRGGRETK
jgi:hypothetical protein